MHAKTDLAKLLEAVAAGDQRAFADLYAATSPKLFGVILRILRHRGRSEEVLQETYLVVWERAETFDGTKASPITWLCTIARNRAIDDVRRRTLPVAAAPVEDFDPPDQSKSPYGELAHAQDLARLEDCLGQMDEAHARAVRAAYLEGQSRAELAAAMERPEGTIKTWLRRGLLQLRDCLNR